MITSQDKLNQKNLSAEMQRICKRLNFRDIKEALYFPRYFQVETSRLCNSRCPYCAHDQWDQSVPFMADNLFDKVADELWHFKDWIEWVCLSRAGEPLLDKKIAQRVRLLKEKGLKRLNLVTNASLLNGALAGELLDAGLDEIMFSIDSIEKEEYEKIKIGLDYEKVINNIQSFFRLRDSLRPEVIVRVRAVAFLDLNKEQDRKKLRRWGGFWSKFKKPQDRIYMKRPHTWGNQKVWEGHTPQYELVYHPCILPWSTLHITAMGTVTVCPMDYDAKMSLGDVNQRGIQEIWQSQKLADLRNLHSSGQRNEISFCKGCKIFDPDFSMEGKV